MKRVILVALAVALAPAAGAQLYKYVDKNGKTTYSDQPPPDVESKRLSVPSARPTAPPAESAKSAVERDKELEKSRKQVAKKSEEAAEKAAQAQARCNQLRAYHQTFADGGRIQKYNDKGERVHMSDAEIESERERSRQEMEEACKS
jgi:hypothetical protein